MPYLNDNMRRLNVYPYITELSHGNQKKSDRIVWALQGRMEQGRLTFSPGDYLKKLTEQLLDFPNPLVHDDMIDSLAYIDQIAVTPYEMNVQSEEWEALDPVSGM
jgi:phage terminase large subunit-like protein